MFEKASKNVHINCCDVSCPLVFHSKFFVCDTEEDPYDSEPAGKGDIQMEYYCD